MSDHFGRAALRLYPLAARLLGWRPDEFWNATPAEFVSALAPPEGAAPGFARDELNRLMEQENGPG